MSIRSRFKCVAIDGSTVKMSAVYQPHDESEVENAEFVTSGAGPLEFQCNNPRALAQLKAGKEYYIEIKPAR